MIAVAKYSRREVENLVEAKARSDLSIVDGVRYTLKVAKWTDENGLELELVDNGPQPEAEDDAGAWD